MFQALDSYPWRVFSPEDRLSVLYSKLPSGFPASWVVSSTVGLCTSGPAALIQVSFIPSCPEVTYLLHLPFPITTESLHWLRARSRSSRFLWQTRQAGMLLIRGSAARKRCGKCLLLHLLRLGKAFCFQILAILQPALRFLNRSL